jgi:hypothetical protein
VKQWAVAFMLPVYTGEGAIKMQGWAAAYATTGMSFIGMDIFA